MSRRPDRAPRNAPDRMRPLETELVRAIPRPVTLRDRPCRDPSAADRIIPAPVGLRQAQETPSRVWVRPQTRAAPLRLTTPAALLPGGRTIGRATSIARIRPCSRDRSQANTGT